jgi:integrase
MTFHLSTPTGKIIPFTLNKRPLRPIRALREGSKVKLTKTVVEAIKPTERDFFVWDMTLPSFGIRVHTTGRKVWIVRYRTTAGTQRKMNIGRCDVLPPDTAREKARQILAEAAAGGDPVASRRDTKGKETIADLSRYFTDYKANLVKAGTKANHKSNWGHINKLLGKKRIADLTFADVQIFHTERGKAHRVNANRCVAQLKAAMNYAERMGWRPRHTNPCKEIQFFPEFERQRIVKPDELPRLWAAIEGYQVQRGCWAAKYGIKLLLLSGLRKNEWACARWDWLDMNARTLTLPDSKTGPRTIHLSDPVMIVLQELRGLSDSDWIIPNSNGNRPMRGLGRHWAKIRKTAGLDDVRVHDLRHTVGTMAHLNGLSQKEISDLLGHRRLSTSARYIHSFDDRRRAAANIAASAVIPSK